jgi:hypothetical protein
MLKQGLPAEQTFRSYDGSVQPRPASRKTHVARIAQGLGHISSSVRSSGLAIVTSGSAGSHQRLLFCPICAWPYIWLVLTIGSSVYGATACPNHDAGNAKKVFTLQMRLKYDLEDLRLRKEL